MEAAAALAAARVVKAAVPKEEWVREVAAVAAAVAADWAGRLG